MHLLTSFVYAPSLLNLVRWSQGCVTWMLDSGGFSAANVGKTIAVGDYVAFCKQNGHLFEEYVSLDEPRNWAKSRDLALTMCNEGLDPMVVVTTDAPLEGPELDLFAGRSLAVAGGTVMPLRPYLRRVNAVRARFPDTKIHGLGFTRGLQIVYAPIDTVDSSSWLAGKRYGAVMYFDVSAGVRTTSITKLAKAPTGKVLDILLKQKITVRDLQESRGSWSCLSLFGTFAWLEYADWLTARGITLFFAVATVHDALQLMFSEKARRLNLTAIQASREATSFWQRSKKTESEIEAWIQAF